MAKVRLTPGAKTDLSDEISFLRQRSTSAAERLIARLEQRLKQVAMFRRIGKRAQYLPELSDEDRVIVVDRLNVYYEVIGDEVSVNRIVHSAHDIGSHYFQNHHTSE